MNPAAIWALIIGVLPNVPGFLVVVGALDKGAVWPGLVALYSYSWFVGFLVSGAVYLLLMRGQTVHATMPQPVPSLAQ